MGLTCEQIVDLLPVWDGSNCAGAHERVGLLIAEKRAEIATRVAELRAFAAELDAVHAALDAAPPPSACCTDLSCCVPEGPVRLRAAGAGPQALTFAPGSAV